MSKSTTQIKWFNGVTYTTTEIYNHYGFNQVESLSGMKIQDIVWKIIIQGSCNPIVNGEHVFGITPTLVTETETETLSLERRNHDVEYELVQTINKACFMQGAQTRGLSCYDEFVEEYFGDWISVLDDAVAGLGDYINYTLFSTRRDLQTKRTLQKAYNKGMRKLDKYCGTEG